MGQDNYQQGGGAGQPGNQQRNQQSGMDRDREMNQSQSQNQQDGMGGGMDSDMDDNADLAMQIREDMEVVDAVGEHVGTVDRCEDGQIKLTRNDSPDGEHRFIPLGQVDNVEGGLVTIRGSASDLSSQESSY